MGSFLAPETDMILEMELGLPCTTQGTSGSTLRHGKQIMWDEKESHYDRSELGGRVPWSSECEIIGTERES